MEIRQHCHWYRRPVPNLVAAAVEVVLQPVRTIRLRFHRRPYKMRSNSIHTANLQRISCCLSRYGGNPAVLESFGESFRGFSEEARTRGFPSPPFGGFGFSRYYSNRPYSTLLDRIFALQ